LHRLPPILRRFKKNYPEVLLQLQFMDSEDACQQVENGQLELAIVTLPASAQANLSLQTIWPDPLAFVCSHDHPLAAMRRPTLHQITTFGAVLPGKGTFTRQLIETALERAGEEIQTVLETNYLETVKMMAAVGLGWSVLPEIMVSKELHRLPLKSPRIERRLGILQHRNRTLSNAARAFLELLPKASRRENRSSAA
jgi:DNA-binding transcriptional LysR family regulator